MTLDSVRLMARRVIAREEGFKSKGGTYEKDALSCARSVLAMADFVERTVDDEENIPEAIQELTRLLERIQ
jgi:hypothetical protein